MIVGLPFNDPPIEYRIDGTQVWTRTLGEEEWHFDPENTAMRERLAARQTSTREAGRED